CSAHSMRLRRFSIWRSFSRSAPSRYRNDDEFIPSAARDLRCIGYKPATSRSGWTEKMTNYQIAEKLSAPIAIVNEHGGVEWHNDAFESTFGPDAKDWLKEGARVVGGERGWLQDFFMDSDDHRAVDVEIEGRTFRVEHIMNVEGQASRAVAIWFEDVTQQRQMEQTKSDFTAQIVHDLRGPLSGIQGTLEFVLSQEGNKLDSMYSDLLQEAQRESERMMGLVNELLDFSKIEAGNL